MTWDPYSDDRDWRLVVLDLVTGLVAVAILVFAVVGVVLTVRSCG